MSRLGGVVISAALRAQHRRLWGHLDALAMDPASAQLETLRRILGQHVDTAIGAEFRFASITTALEFSRTVPVNDYESLRGQIELQEASGEPILTDENPILYARTSGTTGEPKYLPVTPSGLKSQSAAQRLVATVVNKHSAVYGGKLLTIGAPAIEGYRPGGKPYGSASGLIVDGMPAMVRGRYVLGPEISEIEDHDQRQFAIAAASLAEPRLTAIATANPSTVVRLRDIIAARWSELLDAVAVSDSGRATELGLLGEPEALQLGELWPRLQVLMTWTVGSCGLALQQLRPYLPPGLKLFELGYTASELRGSVPIEPNRPDCVPLLGDVFFEFVERATWESGTAEFQGLADLDVGAQYYIFVTTIDGLYRYDMNDIVEIIARYKSTPTMSFVQKGKGVTNITGEKLAESQLIDATLMAGGGRIPGQGFFLCLANSAERHYELFIEGPLEIADAELETSIETALRVVNIEYDSKRASGRLHPIRVREVVAGTGDAYRRECVGEGQRDVQFKYLRLQTIEDCPFDLAAAVKA